MFSWILTALTLSFFIVSGFTEKRNNGRFCLHKTRVTIFIDMDLHYYVNGVRSRRPVDEIHKTFYMIKNVLKQPCFNGQIFNQATKSFVELTGHVETTLENIFSTFNTTSFPDIADMQEFVSNIKDKCSSKLAMEKEVILYLRITSSDVHDQLKRLSQGGNCAVIVVCFLRYVKLDFPELSWLSAHRLVLVPSDELVYGEYQSGLMSTAHRTIHDLILNPNFNRFENNQIILLTDFQFPTSMKNKTIYFWLNFPHTFIGSVDRTSFISQTPGIDLEAYFQLMSILKEKLEQVECDLRVGFVQSYTRLEYFLRIFYNLSRYSDFLRKIGFKVAQESKQNRDDINIATFSKGENIRDSFSWSPRTGDLPKENTLTIISRVNCKTPQSDDGENKIYICQQDLLTQVNREKP